MPHSLLAKSHNVLNRAPRISSGALLLSALALGAALCVLATGCAMPGFVQRWGEEPTRELGAPSAPGDEPDVWTGDGVPLIRVGLADGVSAASVRGRGGFTVRVYADTVESWTSMPGEEWRFEAEASGLAGTLGGEGFLIDGGTVRLAPHGDGLLVFEGAAYRGEIEIFPSGPGSLTVVNVVDVESYLRGVVPKEIGSRPESEIEAVKAQAVAARTYAVAAGGRRARGDFDVFSTVEDQVYGGADVEDAVCDRAILETAGVYAGYDGEPIHAYFHATCGGRTEGRHEVWELERLGYLSSVRDAPGAGGLEASFCKDGAHFTWEEAWSGSELEKLVKDHLPGVASTPVRQELGDVRNLRVSATTPSGRVKWLEVETAGGKYRVFGDKTRWLLRRSGGGVLWSSWFELDVERRGGKVARVTARGRGYGHGVGMCQHGALGMARQGRSYEQILRHYYPGIDLAQGYEVSGP